MAAVLAEVQGRFLGRYCILFLDGAGAHISHDLQVPSNMHLKLLPPRSPELNPVEPVWDYVREHYFANSVFPSIERVEARLRDAFRGLDAEPEGSITLFDWIKAAELT